jgi:hypothetical protein
MEINYIKCDRCGEVHEGLGAKKRLVTVKVPDPNGSSPLAMRNEFDFCDIACLRGALDGGWRGQSEKATDKSGE